VLSALGAAAGSYGASLGVGVRALATAAAIALNVTLFIVAFKVLTARPVTIGQIRAGAVAAAVIWQALQLAGALLLGHKLKGATATYGLFALVLSLLAWIYPRGPACLHLLRPDRTAQELPEHRRQLRQPPAPRPAEPQS
jgi:membrane protein